MVEITITEVETTTTETVATDISKMVEATGRTTMAADIKTKTMATTTRTILTGVLPTLDRWAGITTRCSYMTKCNKRRKRLSTSTVSQSFQEARLHHLLTRMVGQVGVVIILAKINSGRSRNHQQQSRETASRSIIFAVRKKRPHQIVNPGSRGRLAKLPIVIAACRCRNLNCLVKACKNMFRYVVVIFNMEKYRILQIAMSTENS